MYLNLLPNLHIAKDCGFRLKKKMLYYNSFRKESKPDHVKFRPLSFIHSLAVDLTG